MDESIDAILNRGLAHHQAGRLGEAEQLYRAVLQADPRCADARHLLGLVALQAGQADVAVGLLEGAIRLRGNSPVYHNNLGEALRMLSRWDEAIAAYQQAIRLQPSFAEAHNNLGTVYQNQGRLDAALASYETAIACKPDYANAHYNRARTWISRGDFERGWREYEWRWQRTEFVRPVLRQPAWDGSPLAGRTLLVQCEQGLGDTLQFIRYLPALQAAGDKVLVEVQPPLMQLLADSGIANLVTLDRPLPPFDVQAMLMSLPMLLGTKLETIPANVPYLAARKNLIEAWSKRLAHEPGRLKVGIQWQGNPRSPLEPWRSMPLAEFAPLANIPGVQLFSLQQGFGSEQVAPLAATLPLTDWTAELDRTHGPFLDTAALIKSLDLVITSDSVTAHLAGALGVPVWVALSTSADFRWLRDRTDSPWYPTMRLFRQRRLGAWNEVFAEIAAELRKLVA